MGKYTPGPWKISEYTSKSDEETHIGVDTDYPPGLNNGARSIATMTGGYYTRPGEFHKPDMVTINRANAALIAAAPDLLEACKAAIEWEKLWQKGAANGEMACLKTIRAAIARAEGGVE